MLTRVAANAPSAHLEGFTVEAMIERPHAQELLLGLATDKQFGCVILFGQGGTAAELLKDRAIGLPPLNSVLARDLIAHTNVSRLLKGWRDHPPADEAAIVAVLLKLGEIAADCPEIVELDINPLLADESGAIALDARIRVARPAGDADRFAIRPYPRELEKAITDSAGRTYLLRPIKPEDAPLLTDMIAHSNVDDIQLRFFQTLKDMPEALAARLSQIDYDREMCFCAIDEAGAIAGTARLFSDPEGERGEFTVFVRSDRQGTGLGYRLMEEIVGYARASGHREIFGDVLARNSRMLKMCGEFGFARRAAPDDAALLEVSLVLAPAS